MDKMKSINLSRDGQYLFYRAALTVKYDDEERSPVTPEQLIFPRWWEGKNNDFWTTYQRSPGEYNKGTITQPERCREKKRTRPVAGIDGDIRLSKALWMIAEQFRECKS